MNGKYKDNQFTNFSFPEIPIDSMFDQTPFIRMESFVFEIEIVLHPDFIQSVAFEYFPCRQSRKIEPVFCLGIVIVIIHPPEEAYRTCQNPFRDFSKSKKENHSMGWWLRFD